MHALRIYASGCAPIHLLFGQACALDLKHVRKNTHLRIEGMGMGPRYRIMTTRSDLRGWTTKLYLKRFKRQSVADITGHWWHTSASSQGRPVGHVFQIECCRAKSGAVQENSALGATPNRPLRCDGCTTRTCCRYATQLSIFSFRAG